MPFLIENSFVDKGVFYAVTLNSVALSDLSFPHGYFLELQQKYLTAEKDKPIALLYEKLLRGVESKQTESG